MAGDYVRGYRAGLGRSLSRRFGAERAPGRPAEGRRFVGVDLLEVVHRVAIVEAPDAVHQLAVVLQWSELAAWNERKLFVVVEWEIG